MRTRGSSRQPGAAPPGECAHASVVPTELRVSAASVERTCAVPLPVKRSRACPGSVPRRRLLRDAREPRWDGRHGPSECVCAAEAAPARAGAVKTRLTLPSSPSPPATRTHTLPHRLRVHDTARDSLTASAATHRLAMSLYDTSSSTVARHWQTQLALSVAFLKQLNGPIRLEDLALRSGVEGLLHNHELVEGLKKHERVRYTEKTGLFAYKVRLRFRTGGSRRDARRRGVQCQSEAERSSSPLPRRP